MKTESIKSNEIVRDWYIVDAKDKTLGRLASSIAQILRGKNKVNFSPNLDMSDFIIVINAEKVILTGNKKILKNIGDTLVIQVDKKPYLIKRC